ncbi:response regulator [Coraliomargarita sp. W4R72]
MQKNNKLRVSGIFMATAGLAWGIALIVVLIFAFLIIPGQTRAFQESLRSKAQAISASLNEVISGSVVSEDYSSVVDHCMKILDGDPSILYLVITRNDGFSLIHRPGHWEMEDLGEEWRPATRIESDRLVESPTFADEEVYAHSVPFNYSAIEWGWLHIGLSLDTYHADLKELYLQVAFSAVIALFVAFLGSILYSRRLSAPIITLRDAVTRIAHGDLTVKADVSGVIEIEELADGVNRMAVSLSARSQVLEVLRKIGQKLLATENWKKELPPLMADLGGALEGCGLCIYERIVDEPEGMIFARRMHWLQDGANESGLNFTETLNLKDWGLAHYENDLQQKKRSSFTSLEIKNEALGGALRAAGVEHLMTCPVLLRDQVWGLLICVSTDSARAWSQGQFDAFSAVADMLSSVVERDVVSSELITAKEHAEAASLAKTRFLANMSHEIRTPINGIMGMLQLLKRSGIDERSMDYVDTAMSSSKGLLGVIGNILDLSKIEAGKFEIEEREFDLSELCSDLLDPFTSLAHQTEIELVCYVDENSSGTWKGAESLIRQVLINLLGNAFKFTTQGEIVLSVTTNLLDAKKSELLFEVRDTGSGISTENQRKIFDSFVQLDDSLTRKQPGSGLGLTICRDICKMLGGMISLQSKEGKGSAFTARIPMVQIASDKKTTHTVKVIDGKKVRILIVDDSTTVQGILASYVESWGFRCEVVGTEAACLEQLRHAALENDEYDLVMIDRGIPTIDVFGLVAQVNGPTVSSNASLILMDNYSDPLSAEDLVRFGFAGSIRKPIVRSQLYNIIADSFDALSSVKTAKKLTVAPFQINSSSKMQGRVLVAEDNEVNQDVASELLLSLGFEVECVPNGLEAINRINEGGIDCLLLDCQMPVMDGYTAASEIRTIEKIENRGHLPIIALTAHAMEGDREHCLAVGMDDYLSKPLDFDDLEKVLRKQLAHLEQEAIDDDHDNGQTRAVTKVRPIGKAAINYEELLERVRGNEKLVTRLVAKFKVQAAIDFAEIEEAFIREDEELMRTASHRLKGSALTVSANEIGAAAKALEKSPGARRTDRGALIQDLKLALSQL